MKNLKLFFAGAFFCFLLLSHSSRANISEGFADLVEEQSKAVVNVSTSTKAKKIKKSDLRKKSRRSLTGDPFFDKFFDDFIGGFAGQEHMDLRPKQSLGSGVVISKDGYIVTNSHVVSKADSIIIKFQNGEELKAKIIGSDKRNDLSLLKVESGHDLSFARLGDSDKIRVGDWTIAIGNPFGLGGTVTAGILSARGRNIHQGPYDDFLQTDAAINPGNSGGPLFNKSGEIIGINTAILSRSGGSQGIGFAVPSNTVKLIVEQIKEYGRPIRGWLGVRIQTITKELAEALELKNQVGALVAAVVADSPAQKAGIKEGDLILTFDGREVKKMSDLPKLVAETTIDKKIKIKVLRGHENKILTAVIAELEEDVEAHVLSQHDDKSNDKNTVAGMNLSSLTKNEREALLLDDDIEGVLVTAVEFNSRAYKSGLKEDDIIIAIAKKKVTHVKAVEKILKEKAHKSLLMLILRDSSKHFIAFQKESIESDKDE